MVEQTNGNKSKVIKRYKPIFKMTALPVFNVMGRLIPSLTNER
jgi:hypothetical protein